MKSSSVVPQESGGAKDAASAEGKTRDAHGAGKESPGGVPRQPLSTAERQSGAVHRTKPAVARSHTPSSRIVMLARLGKRWRNTAHELTLDDAKEPSASPTELRGRGGRALDNGGSKSSAHPAADGVARKQRPIEPAALEAYGNSSSSRYRRCLRRCGRRAQSTLRLQYINETMLVSDFFVHWLLSLSWPELISVSVGTSFVCILVFTGLFVGLDGVADVQSAFALSTQTFLTIGYGSLAPTSLWGHTIVFLETYVSVLVLAVVTGVPYIKFSKPSPKLVFAKPVLNRGPMGPQLQIRMCVDTQHAQMVNARFKLTLARTERSSMGTAFTFFDELQLKTERAALVALNFTITHYLNAETSFLYRYLQQAVNRHELKHPSQRSKGDPLEFVTFFLILNVEGTDITYQDVIYATEVFQPNDLQFDRFYCDMISATGVVVHDGDSVHNQLEMDVDKLPLTAEKADADKVSDPVIVELVKESTRDGRELWPMIDAPHALMHKFDRGSRPICCQRRPKKSPPRFLVKAHNSCARCRKCSSNLYWFSLQLNFALVVLLALVVWTLLNFLLSILFVIPFNVTGTTEHLSYDSFTGPDHDRGDTLAASFFFAVQTLSSVGYGNLQPTTWYGDFTVAFFGSIAVVLISVFGGIVFSHLVSVKALIKFSDKAVISNYALDGRNYFQFKIYGQWRRDPTINVSVSVFVLVKGVNEHGTTQLTWESLKLRCSSFPIFDVPVTVLHEVTGDSPFRSLLKERKTKTALPRPGSAEEEQLCGSDTSPRTPSPKTWVATTETARREVVEIAAYVTGYDTTYGAAVHAHHMYSAANIMHNMHFKEQIYFCPMERANFVDMSVFHEVEKDVLWYNRILLRRVFDVLKQQWQLKDVLKRVQSGSLQEGFARMAHRGSMTASSRVAPDILKTSTQ